MASVTEKHGAEKIAASSAETVAASASELRATEEQLAYAAVLGNGRKIGLGVIVISFIVYLSGIIAPAVPLNKMPELWGLSSDKFMAAIGIKPGWSWVTMYNHSDMLSYYGIAILGLVSVIAYLAIIPKLARKKDTAYLVIAILEVTVLLVAASGIVHVSAG